MRDIRIAGRTLRLFWRGFRCPQRPYAGHDWGLYFFGAGPLGVMYWPKRGRAHAEP